MTGFRERAWATISSVALCGCSLFEGLAPCDTQVQKQVRSPGGQYVATVFHRECGATTGFNTQVGIRRSSKAFDPQSGQVLAIAGQHDVTLAWIGNTRLVVSFPPDRVYNEQRSWEDVQVEYKTLGTP